MSLSPENFPLFGTLESIWKLHQHHLLNDRWQIPLGSLGAGQENIDVSEVKYSKVI